MNRRDNFVVAHCTMFGVTELEADRLLRDVELDYAERQNAELQQALDSTDGEHVREVAALRTAITAALARHQPIAGDGGPYCITCTQEEKQPPPVGWWVPYPCETAEILTAVSPKE